MSKRFNLAQVAELSRVSEDQIVRFVTYSWVIPGGEEDHIFDHEDIARIRLIRDLQETFGVNQDAVPIVLHLIDQLNRLHRELRERTGA